MGSIISCIPPKHNIYFLSDANSIPEAEKKLILETWAIIRNDAIPNGGEIFLRLFGKHPELKRLFSNYREVPQKTLMKDKSFQAHCAIFMHTLNSIIDYIDDKELVKYILKNIGEKHAKLGISKDQFEIMKNVLLVYIKEKLGTKYDPAAARAWEKVMKFMFDTMIAQLEP